MRKRRLNSLDERLAGMSAPFVLVKFELLIERAVR